MTTRATAGHHWLVVAGLRRWAEGSAVDEAAVELLAGLGAKFMHANCPWVRPCRRPGWFWLDSDALRHPAGRLTDREARVLALVVALLTDQADTSSSGVDVGRRAA